MNPQTIKDLMKIQRSPSGASGTLTISPGDAQSILDRFDVQARPTFEIELVEETWRASKGEALYSDDHIEALLSYIEQLEANQ